MRVGLAARMARIRARHERTAVWSRRQARLFARAHCRRTTLRATGLIARDRRAAVRIDECGARAAAHVLGACEPFGAEDRPASSVALAAISGAAASGGAAGHALHDEAGKLFRGFAHALATVRIGHAPVRRAAGAWRPALLRRRNLGHTRHRRCSPGPCGRSWRSLETRAAHSQRMARYRFGHLDPYPRPHPTYRRSSSSFLRCRLRTPPPRRRRSSSLPDPLQIGRLPHPGLRGSDQRRRRRLNRCTRPR